MSGWGQERWYRLARALASSVAEAGGEAVKPDDSASLRAPSAWQLRPVPRGGTIRIVPARPMPPPGRAGPPLNGPTERFQVAHILAQVRLKRTTNLPEDIVVNTFHFDAAPTLDDGAAITTSLLDFYRVAHGGAQSIASFLSPVLNATPHQVRLYNMTGPPPHIPFMSTDFTMTGIPQSGTPLPSEVALVLTIKAAAGANPMRRRGRIYLGPFNTGQATGILEGDSRPTTGLMQTLLNAGAFLRDDLPSAQAWQVWSEVDQALRPVTTVQVDNAWDTQRRRGAKPYARLSNPA